MSGWTTKKLGEVCEVQLGKMLDKAKNKGKPYKYLANLSVRWRSFDLSNLRTMPFMDSEVEKFSLRPGDILMCEGGEPGRCAIWQIPDSDIKFQKAVHRIRSKGTIEPAYLVAYFESIVNTVEFNSRLTGATIKHLPRERLLEIPIPIPPLAEQKRIVAKIDAAFEKIDRLKANAEKNLANAKELFQSALDEAMRPKKGWVEKRLGEVCSKIGSGATPRGGKASYCSKGISLIRSMNVYDCAFEYSELAHINDMQAKELANVTIEANDVLINITGASIARCCVVPSDVMPARVNQHVAILRIADNRFLNPDFLCYSLVAPARKSLLLGIGEAGSTRQALTKNDLSSFMISIPDLFEQKRIVERIRALAQTTKTLQQNYARQIADCAEMRQAILREAFEGRL